MEGTPVQVFVRNDKGRIWGPLEPQTVELLIDSGQIDGRVQVSEDGIHFAFPGRFPALRDFFPRHLWGTEVMPADAAAPPRAAAPAAPIILGDAPAAAGAAKTATHVPMAGPGAFAAAAARAAQGRAPVPGAGRAPPVITPAAGASAPSPLAPAPPAGASAPSPHAPVPPAANAPSPGAPVPPAPSAPSRPAANTPSPGAPVPPAPSAPSRPAANTAATPPAPGTRPTATAPGPSVAPAPPTPAPAARIAPPAEPQDALPASGDLAKTSPIHLYYLAAAGNHSSLITFVLPDREIGVHFRRGNPEYVGSNHVEDMLATFLLRNNLVDASAIAEAEAAKERFGGELVGALFGLGKLNAGTAFPHLASRRQGLLLRALSAETGTFRVEEKELDPHRSMPLGNKWGVLAEALRRLPAPDLRRRLQSVLDLPVMKSGGRAPVQELRLTPQETRAFSFMDGVRSLNQLMRDLPQDTEHFLRVALLLKELEVIAFGLHPVADRPPPPRPAVEPAPAAPAVTPAAAPPAGAAPASARPAPAATSAGARPAAPRPPGAAAPPGTTAAPGAKPAATPPRPAPATATATRPAAAPAAPAPAARPAAAPAPAAEAPAAPVSFSAQIDDLKKRVAKLKDQNLFQLLEVDPKADSAAVKLAYFKMARVFHPDTVPPDAPPELLKLKGDLFGAIGEAYRRLGEDKSRAEYLEEMQHGGGEKVDVQQILMAEELFQKGCILVKARKFPEAVKMLDEAIAANDKEGEFYAWRGYAKFFTHTDRPAGKVEAHKDFQKALKMNERVASLHYFMGHVAKLTGDNAGALKYFKRAIELNPEHIDAQRELRMMGPAKR